MFKTEHKIKVMINKSIRGKMPKDATVDDWKAFHRSWRLEETTPKGLAKIIYNGWTITNYYEGWKSKENHKESWFMGFDFDGGTVDDGLEALYQIGSFADYFSSFGYTTPSHTDEAPRSRVIVIFDSPILSIDYHERLYPALADMFGANWDEACKDALRIFYGSPQCQMRGNWSVFQHHKPTAQMLIDDYEVRNKPREVVTVPRREVQSDAAQRVAWKTIETLGQNIANAPEGDRHNTRVKMAFTAGGHGAGASLSQNEVINYLTPIAISNEPDAKEACIKDVEGSVIKGWGKPIYPTIYEDVII